MTFANFFWLSVRPYIRITGCAIAAALL